jgi:hypothetical protein
MSDARHEIRFDYEHPVHGPSEGVASVPKKAKKPTLKDVTLHSAGLKGDVHVGAEDLSPEDHQAFKQAALEHHLGMKKTEEREYEPLEVALAVLSRAREIGMSSDLLKAEKIRKGEGPNSAHNVEPGKMPGVSPEAPENKVDSPSRQPIARDGAGNTSAGNSRAENGNGHSQPEKEVAGAPRDSSQTKLPQTPQEPKRDGKGPSDAVTKDPAAPSQERSAKPHAEAVAQDDDKNANSRFVRKSERCLAKFMAKREEKMKNLRKKEVASG